MESEEIVRHTLLYCCSDLVGGWVVGDEVLLEVLVNFHYRCKVPASVAVVWG